MSLRQRLVVCLDGTWNKQDDSTNVLHHFALALDGAQHGEAHTTQTKHYLAGVGTGVLDRISGGGFAFGLEENVRAAYDWLVENYRDDDEIYIFGFSRGAYTARSLVGFIATCGLLRRGAPVSINQLWKDYCVLGRQREERTSFWDHIFDEPETTVRRINDLIVDPWYIEAYEQYRVSRGLPAGANDSRVAGQLVDDLNTTERLLVRWSRRVKITYLGIYDTVGAVGIDALAIPGLKSRLAMHHNMRPTTIIQHCRHALALDEHRSSFKHTPFMAYVRHGRPEDDGQKVALRAMNRSGEGAERDWSEIKQRWFAGAHSNVGGGYPDNELAQRPLEWLLEGACELGLTCEPFSFATPPTPPPLRDSYAEFARPLWTDVIRGKRFYRQIDPEPEVRASRPIAGEAANRTPGFSLKSINEEIDQTVLNRVRDLPDYHPPNLVEYARRKLAQANAVSDPRLSGLIGMPPVHKWFGTGYVPHLVLILWATCAGIGVVPIVELFAPEIHLEPSLPLGLICGGLAFVFALVDWGESRANFSLALGPSSPRWRAFLDSVYWTRALGFVLAIVGAGTAAATLWTLGWNGDTQQIAKLMWWSLVPLFAGVGVVAANALDRANPVRMKSGFLAALSGCVAATAAVVFVIALGWLVEKIFRPAFGFHRLTIVSPAERGHAAGLLLLLQCGLAYFVTAFRWVSEPMSTANLGSIVPLQLCRTPDQVWDRLETWREMLVNSWNAEDATVHGPAGRAMRDAVRQALWRDIFGLIPVYGLVLGFGVWYALDQLGRPHVWPLITFDLGSFAWWKLVVPIGLSLPFVAVVTDYLEDACHIRYLALHEVGEKPGIWLTIPSFTASIVKLIAFVSAASLTAVGFLVGAIDLPLLGESTGWRGSVALLVSELVLLFVFVTVAGYVGTKFVRTARQHKQADGADDDEEFAFLGEATAVDLSSVEVPRRSRRHRGR